MNATQSTAVTFRTLSAKFAGTCPVCRGAIHVGQPVLWAPGQKARHTSCGSTPAAPATTLSQRPRYRMGSGAGSAAQVRGYSSYCTDREGCRCYDCAS